MASRRSGGEEPRCTRAPGRRVRWGVWAVLGAGLGAISSLGVIRAWPAVEPGPVPGASASSWPTGGSLVICGGGPTPDAIRDRFVELAGGPKARIVVIPTARPSADTTDSAPVRSDWTRYRLAAFQLLHARSRTQADDPEFTRPLAMATGVWFCGGFQERLTDVYLGTAVERLLQDVLAHGGVVGGTSAGAAVMTRVMIADGIETAKLAQGFDLLPGAVVDQHFLKRNRMKRLLGAVRSHPELIGLGVDEQTALIVDLQARRLRVVGASYVVACIPEPAAGSHEPPPTRLEILRAGDEADLLALKLPTASASAIVSTVGVDAP
jgi:cyanophycinase